MKTKIIFLIVAACLLFAVCGVSAAAASDHFTAACDLDGDGRVNSSDARVLLRKSAGLEELVQTQAAAELGVALFGDFDADGRANSADARLLLRYASRLATEQNFLVYNAAGDMLVPESGSYAHEDPPAAQSEAEFVASLPRQTLLTPYADHGLGTTAMVVAKSDYAELSSAESSNLRSYPLTNPYLKGTADYVTSTGVYGGTTAYSLASGAKIEAPDATYLATGYRLPVNTLSLQGTFSDAGETVFYFKTDWKIPIRVQFKPQKYYTGYENRPYNLTSFTAEYMEIRFYHTGRLDGSFSFPSGSVFSGAETETDANAVTLRLKLSRVGGAYGYDISYTENGYLRISAKNPIAGVAGKTIVLDPGHGGVDGGGGSNGVYEAGINLSVLKYLQTMLANAGANVIMTRDADYTVSLAQRVEITRTRNADLFLSVHCDVADATSAAGVSVYYYYPFSMPYAQALQDGLVSAYRSSVYSSSSANYGKVDRGIKFYPFQVARVETCPAVLVELGFLTNAAERAALQNSANQQALAAGLYNGIVNYFAQRG